LLQETKGIMFLALLINILPTTPPTSVYQRAFPTYTTFFIHLHRKHETETWFTTQVFFFAKGKIQILDKKSNESKV